MKIENWNKKPSSVREAAHNHDKEALSAMGKKGAKIAKENREKAKEVEEVQNERLKEIREQQEQERIRSANEHIISPDGEDFDYSDSNT